MSVPIVVAMVLAVAVPAAAGLGEADRRELEAGGER
jgi:hypothetical protein